MMYLYVDPKNFATIRTTSIVQRQQKEHLQETEMQDQMSGYKRLRRDHQVILYMSTNNRFIYQCAKAIWSPAPTPPPKIHRF